MRDAYEVGVGSSDHQRAVLAKQSPQRANTSVVVDFLHFRLWGGYSWPDFNLADSFIVVGVMLLVIELLATESESRDEAPAASSKS